MTLTTLGTGLLIDRALARQHELVMGKAGFCQKFYGSGGILWDKCPPREVKWTIDEGEFPTGATTIGGTITMGE